MDKYIRSECIFTYEINANVAHLNSATCKNSVKMLVFC